MRIETCQIFASLLENYVNEASTSLNLISGNPGGDAVIKKLHKEMSLAHDQNYRQVEKISWSDLKGSYDGAWVIIIGSKGTGAIKSRGDTYDAVASAGEEIQQATDSRGGNILDFLKSNIGKLQKFYVGRGSRQVKDLQRKRADAKQGADNKIDQATLLKKFKPLWLKAMTAAQADIKGHVANMIKNDAFAKAKNKLNQVERLQDSIESLEGGGSGRTEILDNAINVAVLMAAAHHYPEETGTIARGRYGSGSYSAQHSEGPSKLLQDISNGDTAKLGTILGFFKRALITG